MKGEVYNQSVSIVLKAANLYFSEGKSQKEIAQLLMISEPTVSRLLKRAKKEAIVSFVIQKPFSRCLELESRLKRKYGLREVIVVPPSADQTGPEAVKQAVALEGARYVQRIISPQDVLGIAWGGTMYYLIQYLNPCRKTAASFVTLHGSISCCDYELDVGTLVSRMAMAFGGRHYSLVAEGLMDIGRKLRVSGEEGVRRVFSLFDRITISVSGVGSLYPRADSPLSRLQYLRPEEFAELREKGVYGDLMLRFFDKNGQECDSSLRERTLAIDLEVYRRIPCKIVAASGVQKAYTLQAALRGALVDVLVVDFRLAEAIYRKK